jgi:hypothetical protein
MSSAIIIETYDEHVLSIEYSNTLVHIAVTSNDLVTENLYLCADDARALAKALLDKADELEADETYYCDPLAGVFPESGHLVSGEPMPPPTSPKELRRRLQRVNLQAITDKAAFYARAAAMHGQNLTPWEDMGEDERDIWREAVMNANALPRGSELADRRESRIAAHVHVLNAIQRKLTPAEQQACRPRKGLTNND